MQQETPDSVAVITHNVVPLRAAPDGGSEQISQAILGDRVLQLEERDDYVRARMVDEYEGWIWRGHLRSIAAGAAANRLTAAHGWQAASQPDYYLCAGISDLVAVPNTPETLITKLVVGTRFRVLGSQLPTHEARPGTYDGGVPPPFLQIETPFCGAEICNEGIRGEEEGGLAVTVGYLAARDALPVTPAGYQGDFSGEAACALAIRFIGTPYLWGGTTPFGFDCSGFVQRIYSLLNVTLPRDAYVQARSPLGGTLGPEQPLRAGDLVFFCGRSDPRRRGITHVGMALDAERFIHAYGRRGVTITRCDDPVYHAAYTSICTWRYGARVCV
jgi:hypothetical protein